MTLWKPCIKQKGQYRISVNPWLTSENKLANESKQKNPFDFLS